MPSDYSEELSSLINEYQAANPRNKEIKRKIERTVTVEFRRENLRLAGYYELVKNLGLFNRTVSERLRTIVRKSSSLMGILERII